MRRLVSRPSIARSAKGFLPAQQQGSGSAAVTLQDALLRSSSWWEVLRWPGAWRSS